MSYELVESLYKRGKSSSECFQAVRHLGLSRRQVRDHLKSVNLMASNSHGGYRRKAGRGTPYNFNSVTFDSYGEFCFYLHFFDVHNKYPKKCIESIETLVDDKPYRYTPDFQCDEIFYEIKGFDFHGWNSKKVSNVIGLVVIQTSEIENIIQYCENKYGIDWLNKHKI